MFFAYSNKNKFLLARSILFLAATYNLVWGAWICAFPESILFGAKPEAYLLISLQCIGMLVGVYGIAYLIASQDPLRYWPLILVGLNGKVLGPMGAFIFIYNGDLPFDFLILNLGNDLIWILPFSWVLYHVYKGNLNSNKSSNHSLYQNFLGSNFNLLSPKLKDFHSAKNPIKVVGYFQVWRGQNFFTYLLGSVAGLPPAATKSDVELTVKQKYQIETWHRRIGSHEMVSKQWISQNLLVEKFGPLKVYLKAKVKNGDLFIFDHSVSIWNIPMPPFFTPWVNAHGRDKHNGILIDVEVGFFPFGRVIKYSGLVAKIPN